MTAKRWRKEGTHMSLRTTASLFPPFDFSLYTFAMHKIHSAINHMDRPCTHFPHSMYSIIKLLILTTSTLPPLPPPLAPTESSPTPSTHDFLHLPPQTNRRDHEGKQRAGTQPARHQQHHNISPSFRQSTRQLRRPRHHGQGGEITVAQRENNHKKGGPPVRRKDDRKHRALHVAEEEKGEKYHAGSSVQAQAMGGRRKREDR